MRILNSRWIVGGLIASGLGMFSFSSIPRFVGGKAAELVGSAAPPAASMQMPPCQVWFSPNGGCTAAIVAAIDAAQTSAIVQAYSFTSRPIAEALCRAHARGVDVRVIADKSQRTESHSVLPYLESAGVPCAIDAAHAIAHDKTITIDGQIVISGSFNFTSSAESRNGENLLMLRSPDLAEAYLRNWQRHFAHSERL